MARLLFAVASLLLLALTAPVGHAAASAAPAEECYAPAVPTATTVTVAAQFTAGRTVSFAVDVSADSEDAVVGTLAVRVEAAGGSGVHDQTYTFSGTPVTVALGERPVGSYAITAAFTPQDACAHGASTGVGAFVVEAPPQPPDPDGEPGAGTPGTTSNPTGGELPDTGGPNLMWLLLALLLVAGGSGAVYWSKHRGSPYVSRHTAT